MPPSSSSRKRGRPHADGCRDSARYIVAKVYEEQIAERNGGLGRPPRRGLKGYFRAAVEAVLDSESETDLKTRYKIWKRLEHIRRRDHEQNARMADLIRA